MAIIRVLHGLTIALLDQDADIFRDFPDDDVIAYYVERDRKTARALMAWYAETLTA